MKIFSFCSMTTEGCFGEGHVHRTEYRVRREKNEGQENRVPIFGLKSRYYLSESQANNGGINEYCDLG